MHYKPQVWLLRLMRLMRLMRLIAVQNHSEANEANCTTVWLTQECIK